MNNEANPSRKYKRYDPAFKRSAVELGWVAASPPTPWRRNWASASRRLRPGSTPGREPPPAARTAIRVTPARDIKKRWASSRKRHAEYLLTEEREASRKGGRIMI